MKKHAKFIVTLGVISVFLWSATALGLSDAFKNNIYNPGPLKPIDSILKVKVGDIAPDFFFQRYRVVGFHLTSIEGKKM